MKIIPAKRVSEGAGVIVHRTIGTAALENLDPFLMLDHFGSDNPGDYIAGFPDHPHRGFVTLTYMLDGHMLHRDSMGNEGDLRSGGLQWMKAARGIIHSEMPQQTNGLMRGFQLWINLPAREKMSDPNYHDIDPAEVPVIQDENATIKIIGGNYATAKGPLQDSLSDLQYLDVTLKPQGVYPLQLDQQHSSFIYCFEGNGKVDATAVKTHQLVTLEPGESVQITATDAGMRFIQVSGKPIHEPVAKYGPFVMNNEQELQQAILDYQNGKLTE